MLAVGKIKSKMMRRTIHDLKKNGIELSDDFEVNKKILGVTMPSKKLRNRIAGLGVRDKKQEMKNTLQLEKAK